MTSALVIAHQNITEKNMPHGVLDESCITIIASVDSFLIVSSHMEAIFIKRPEILKDMDELLNTDLATEWMATHTPYEIVAKVTADRDKLYMMEGIVILSRKK